VRRGGGREQRVRVHGRRERRRSGRFLLNILPDSWDCLGIPGLLGAAAVGKNWIFGDPGIAPGCGD
jgi:hypothetical protein